MTALLLTFSVLVGTVLQMITSARDVGNAHRTAVEWWNAEDELIEEVPRMRRRRTRRELRRWRDPATTRDIRHVRTVLLRWVLLILAAGSAVGVSIVNLVR